MSRPVSVCTLLFADLLAALGGCGSESPAASAFAPAAIPTSASSNGLGQDCAARSCSGQAYDGPLMRVSAADLTSAGSADAREVVANIMRYTGLPQNFEIVEGPVPNAAAVILAGPDRLPRRLIAYNPRFLQQVQQSTAQNDWAPVSIMAHEIGHHLSGHTIVPGGSQPPTEH